MTDRERRKPASAGPESVSVWVDNLLTSCVDMADSSRSTNFLDRCNDAAAAATAIRSIKDSVPRAGFEPLPFSQYVERLAYVAGARLGPVLQYLGISSKGDPRALDRPESGAVRLAVLLEIPLRRLLIHLRIAKLLQAGLPGVQFARQRHMEGATGEFLSTIEEELSQLENRIDPSSSRDLEKLEEEVMSLYQDSMRVWERDQGAG